MARFNSEEQNVSKAERAVLVLCKDKSLNSLSSIVYMWDRLSKKVSSTQKPVFELLMLFSSSF